MPRNAPIASLLCTSLELVYLARLVLILQIPRPMKTISTHPRLRSFTLKHASIRRQDEANRLCTWIYQVVASSRLESLHFSAYHITVPRVDINFNDFILPLARQHATTLRFLYLDSLCIGNAMQFLCESFLNLEELSVVDYGGNLVRIYVVHSQYFLLTIAAFTVDFHGIHFKDEEAPHGLLCLRWRYTCTRRSGRHGKKTAIAKAVISERYYVGGW
jgi:hypothetical protein